LAQSLPQRDTSAVKAINVRALFNQFKIQQFFDRYGAVANAV